MALPTVPTVAAPITTTAPTVPSTASAAATGTAEKAPIKQFGPSKDVDGNVIPAPKAAGIDLVGLAKKLWATIVSECEAASVKPDDFVNACALDKPTVPGHKEGRAAYGTANCVRNIASSNGNLTKQRGATGMALANQKIAALDAKMAKLTAALKALGKSDAEINEFMAAQA